MSSLKALKERRPPLAADKGVSAVRRFVFNNQTEVASVLLGALSGSPLNQLAPELALAVLKTAGFDALGIKPDGLAARWIGTAMVSKGGSMLLRRTVGAAMARTGISSVAARLRRVVLSVLVVAGVTYVITEHGDSIAVFAVDVAKPVLDSARAALGFASRDNDSSTAAGARDDADGGDDFAARARSSSPRSPGASGAASSSGSGGRVRTAAPGVRSKL